MQRTEASRDVVEKLSSAIEAVLAVKAYRDFAAPENAHRRRRSVALSGRIRRRRRLKRVLLLRHVAPSPAFGVPPPPSRRRVACSASVYSRRRPHHAVAADLITPSPPLWRRALSAWQLPVARTGSLSGNNELLSSLSQGPSTSLCLGLAAFSFRKNSIAFTFFYPRSAHETPFIFGFFVSHVPHFLTDKFR